jgi:uncharacterized protein YndB with AHSA1/START domain
MTEQMNVRGARAAPRPDTRSAEGKVAINASAERVWKALTDERELVRWFPLDATVTPGPEGSIYMSWRNEFSATMRILLWDPPRHLRTAWSFHEGEQAEVTDYLVQGSGGTTMLRAVTSGFPLDASWDGWVEGTERGWAFELRSLKHYLERHDAEPRHVAYLRRRVPLSAGEAWARIMDGRDFAPWLTHGETFDDRAGSQHAAVVRDPADALFRVSIEPGGPGADRREVVVWLSAWGDHGRRVDELRSEWARALDRLFPEGDTP